MKADRDHIERFARALFAYASEGSVVSLRAFHDRDRSQPPLAIRPVTINGAGLTPVIDEAERIANAAANHRDPVVFCPPVATFKDGANATEGNLAEGLALSVECDRFPAEALAKLSALFGLAPTVTVASGGEWQAPDAAAKQDKLHLHWRLNEPTRSAQDHAKLKEARELAAVYVGSDKTNVPMVHPIRWPGSWHRKAKPRMSAIVEVNEGNEIDLDDILEKLRAAVPGASEGQSANDSTGQKGPEDYADLIRRMAIDGEKHAAVRDVAASLAAQGCSRRFVEGFVRFHCPVWDANVESLIRSAFEKFEADKKAAPSWTDDPVDLWGQFDPPVLPAALLPPLVEEFARVQGARMGADPGGLAVAALVTCAAAIDDSIKLRVKRHDDWLESARLWAALVGSPSTKKSPILSAPTGPLCRIDGEMFREWQRALADWNGLEKEAQRVTPKPLQTRLRIEDATVEAAQMVLEGSPGGALLLQDELSGFFGQMDKYSGGKGANADRAFWLRSFNGGEYAVNRVGRGPALIPNLSLSLLGGIQPEPIRRVAADAHDDGLLQRLFPIILRPATLGHDDPAPDVVGRYRDLIERLHNLRAPQGFAPWLVFDEGAHATRRRLEAEHLRLQSSEAINRKLAAHVGKYDGLFARLCLVWHCVEHAGGPLPLAVTENTAERVAAFLHGFLLPHAFAFYAGTLGLSDDHDRLTAIASYILAHRLERVTNRDVQRGDRAMRKLAEHDVRPLLEQLAALGWLEMVPGPRPTQPPHWLVNPAVHARFAERAAAEAAKRAEARSVMSDLAGAA